MIFLIVIFSLIQDPERLLDRMYNYLQKSLQMMNSYTNSQRILEDHKELINIRNQLEKITEQLYPITQNTLH